MNILDHDFSRKRPPLIIAEIGSGHGGDLDGALGLITDAKRAGAGAVKIQTYTPESMTIRSEAPDFMLKEGLWSGKSLHSLYEEAQTPREWHKDLFAEAKSVGIPLFSSPFSPADVEFLETFDCPAYKIASPEINHMDLLEAVRETGKPVIVSTGMASTAEIRIAVEALYGRDVAILHCMSGYPTPISEANIWMVRDLINKFPRNPIGYSDHTLSDVAAIVAVGCGAQIIEKHIGLPGSQDGDFACRPERFSDFVRRVTMGWTAIQQEIPRCESHQIRRSVYVVAPIKEGEEFTRENLRVIRPGYGMEPTEFERVIGLKAARDLPEGTPMHEEFVAK